MISLHLRKYLRALVERCWYALGVVVPLCTHPYVWLVLG